MHFLRDFPLASFNTFGVAATARQFALVANEQLLMQWCAAKGAATPPLLLGGGSNLLITRDIEAPVLHIAPLGKSIAFDDGDTVVVEAMAGEPWHSFVMWTIKLGLCGLENLALIPGFVGAAPVQNIGAYGVEVADTLYSVMSVNTQTGEPRVFSNDECEFAYRDSFFKHATGAARDRHAILRVRFRLTRKFTPRIDYGDIKTELQQAGVARPSATDVAQAVIRIRTRKLPDPAVIGNAGSFFKNPIVDQAQADALKAQHPSMPHYPAGDGNAGTVKIPAAWLIEATGWKGRRFGNVGVDQGHALVIVNHGGATGSEIWELAQAVQMDVHEKFGVMLEPEPRVV